VEKNGRIKRALSVDNVLRAKFTSFEFEGVWRRSVGCPERSGTWMIYGPPKNGKTTFAMQVARQLTQFTPVLYNSVEEGISLSIRHALEREFLPHVKPVNPFTLVDSESPEELTKRLLLRRSAGVVIIDSVQFWDIYFEHYKKLKKMFPSKLFIYISHQQGWTPQGAVARRIWRDASVVWHVDRFKAFPSGRYGGGEEIVISEERAKGLW